MKDNLKLCTWILGRFSMYFVSFLLLIFAVVVGVVYFKDGNLINLWEMPLDYGSFCLGELLGIYTPQRDLFLMPNQNAVRPDIVFVLIGLAYIVANLLTIRDFDRSRENNLTVEG